MKKLLKIFPKVEEPILWMWLFIAVGWIFMFLTLMTPYPESLWFLGAETLFMIYGAGIGLRGVVEHDG